MSVSCGCVPAGISSSSRPSIVGTCDRRAERRQRRGDVDGRHEVVAVAHEPRVLAHVDLHVQVARRAAALAGVPAPGDPDPLAVGDPGRDVDRHLRRARPCGRGRGTRGRARGDPAVAVAAVAHGGAHDLAERRPRDRSQLAGALALRAGLDRRARLGAVAVAVLAQRSRPRRRPRPASPLAPRPSVISADTATSPPWTAPPRRPPPPPKMSPNATAARRRTPRRCPTPSRSRRSWATSRRCAGPRGRSGRRWRGGRRRTAPRRPRRASLNFSSASGSLAVDVGVQLAREPAERLLDLGLVGVARDAQHLVVVAWHL